MHLKHLNFIHFFMSDKEYLLEVDTIKEVLATHNNLTIVFKPSNEPPPVTEFFVKYAEEEILFFFGNNDKEYDSPVIAKTCIFKSSSIKDEKLNISFLIK